MRRARSQLLVLVLLISCACSEPRTPPKPGGQGAAGAETVRVVFALPGDDLGAPESVALLERIKRAIIQREAGEVIGSGFGMGSMELVVRLRGQSSRTALEGLIREEYPAARFRIGPGGP